MKNDTARRLGYLSTVVPFADMAHAGYMNQKHGGNALDHYADTHAEQMRYMSRGTTKGGITGGAIGAVGGGLMGLADYKVGRNPGMNKKQKLGNALKNVAVNATLGAVTGSIAGSGLGSLGGYVKGSGKRYEQTLGNVKHDSKHSINVKEASGHALLQKLPEDSRIGPNPPSPADKIWEQYRKARTIKNG